MYNSLVACTTQKEMLVFWKYCLLASIKKKVVSSFNNDKGNFCVEGIELSYFPSIYVSPTVKTPDALLVQVLEKTLVSQVYVLRNLRKSKSGKQHIKLQNKHKNISQQGQLKKKINFPILC